MKKLLSFFLLIGQILCQAQEAHYHLGSHAIKYSTGKADLLYEMAAIGRSGFHSRVGGVSFEQVAVPSQMLHSSTISIRYDTAATDGHRLIIHVGNTTDSSYQMDIPDWELVPIAKYADNGYNAVVSLFGPDSAVQYNEAFRNTLLGIRMFQADLMFDLADGTWDLLRDSTNKPIIAESEMKFRHSDTDSLDYEMIMEELLYRLTDNGSYILTDWGREIRFDVTGKDFYLTGEPYYLFTKQVLNPISLIMHAKVIVDGLRDRPEINQNANFRKLAKWLTGNSYYSWYLDSIGSAIGEMELDHRLTIDRADLYMENVRRLIDSCRNNDTVAYNDLQRDPRFKNLEDLCKEATTSSNAEKTAVLIGRLYLAHALYNHYCARIRNFLQTHPNPSGVLAADVRFKSIRRLAFHANDLLDANKIKKAISELGDKYLFSNDTAVSYLSRLDSIPEFDDDSLLIRLIQLKIRVPYPGLDSLYAVADDTTNISTQLLLTQSETIEKMSSYLYNYNPAVYDAYVTVARYAAFFRYIKMHSPQSWATFMDGIAHAHVRASTDTTNLASHEVLLTPNHRPY